MNERVKKRLERLSFAAKDIIVNMKCTLNNIGDVREADDLFVVESAFEKAKRNARDACEFTRETWDLFEEE